MIIIVICDHFINQQELKAIEPSIINVSYTSSVMTDCLANQISTGYRWVPLSIMNITFRVRGLELWCLSPLLTIFHYIVPVRFIGGGNRITGENHRLTTSHWQTLSLNVDSTTLHLSGIRTHNIRGDNDWLHR